MIPSPFSHYLVRSFWGHNATGHVGETNVSINSFIRTLVSGAVARYIIPPAVALEGTRGALEALGHPTRQRILALLLGEPEGLPYGEIAARLGFKEPSSIDQHLKILCGGVLIGNYVSRINGRIRSIYKITDWGKLWMERCEFTDPEQLKLLLAGTRTVAPKT